MAGEQGTHNTEISDSEKIGEIGDILRDVSKRFDSLSTRMDALEARGDSGHRRDGEAEGGEVREPGEPREPIVDKARKDAEEKEAREEERADKARKDAARRDSEREEEERADKARKDSEKEHERAMDSAFGEIANLKSRLADLQGRVPAIIEAGDRERYSAIQEQAEPAYQAFGQRAPTYMDGETPTGYKRRLAKGMQKNSDKWAGHRLSAVSDEGLLDTIVSDVYADSISAARRGVAVAPGQLREVVTRSAAGHTRIEFEGDASAWMDSMAGHTLRAVGRFNTPN